MILQLLKNKGNVAKALLGTVKKYIIIGAAILLFFILAASFTYQVIKGAFEATISALRSVFSDKDNGEGNGKELIYVDYEKGEVKINEAALEKVNKSLKENGLNGEDLNYGDDLDFIRRVIRVEAYTMYPDLRPGELLGTPLKEDDQQGIIKIRRTSISTDSGAIPTLPEDNLDPSTYITSSSTIVEVAKKCHDYLRTNGYTYDNSYNKKIPLTNEKNKHVDCSAYVSWVLYECGFKQFGGGQQTASGINDVTKSWQTIAKKDAQPGDIMLMSGHTQLFAGYDSSGKQMIFNCGYDGAIQRQNPYAVNGDELGKCYRIVRPPVKESSNTDPTKSDNPVIKAAIKVHAITEASKGTSKEYVYDSGVYSQVPSTGTTTDCSHYVSWVLYEAGFTQFKGNQKKSIDFYNNKSSDGLGWEEIPKDKGKVQPGDILLYNVPGDYSTYHVEICAGFDNTGRTLVYNAGHRNYFLEKAPKRAADDFSKVTKILRAPAIKSSGPKTEQISSLKGFTLIGDSYTEGFHALGLLDGVNAYYKIGSAAPYWNQDSNFNSIDASKSKGIIVYLGINNPENTTSMEKFLDRLHSKFGDKTIYVMKTGHVGKSYNEGGMNAQKIDGLIDTYNSKIKSYCDEKGYKFIDALGGGVYDSEGYIAHPTPDGLHIKPKSDNEQLIKNIVDAINGAGGAGTGSATTNETIAAGDVPTDSLNYLSYVTPSKWKEMTAEGASIEQKQESLKHFTLDENNVMIISNWFKEDITQTGAGGNKSSSVYKLTTEKVNYQSLLSKYMVPCEFPIALLLVTNNTGFIDGFINLVKSSILELTIQDNTTVTTQRETTTDTNIVEGNKRYDVTLTANGSQVGTRSQSDSLNNSTSTSTTVVTRTESNSMVVEIYRVSTWLFDTGVTSTYKVNRNTSHDSKDLPPVPGTPVDMNQTGASISHDPRAGELSAQFAREYEQQHKDQSANTVSGYCTQIETHTKSRTETNITTDIVTTSIQYTQTPAAVKLKEDRFLGLIRNKSGEYHQLYKNGQIDPEALYDPTGWKIIYHMPRKSQEVYDNITTGAYILFELLESYDKTIPFDTYMRYLLYKLTDEDFGVKELDPNTFAPETFNSAGGSGSVYLVGEGDVSWKVWCCLIKAGYSEYAAAGVLGNIESESHFDPSLVEKGNGIGYGICQWSFGRRTNLEKFASKRGVDKSDLPLQLEYLLGELNKSGGADGCATYQLMTMTRNGKTYRPQDWINASNANDAGMAFCVCFERPKNVLSVRGTQAEEWYKKYAGKQIPDSVNGGGEIPSGPFAQKIIAAMDKTAKYLEQNNYTYRGTGSVNYKFPIQNNSGVKTLSCSSYVQQCLYEAGYKQFAGGEKIYATKNESKAKAYFTDNGMKVTKVIRNVNDLQPGDILQHTTGSEHIIIVYSVDKSAKTFTVKGVPEVLNANQGFSGKVHKFSEFSNYFGLRVE